MLPYDVQVAYNDDTAFWRVSYRGNRGDRHDFLRYTGGAWRHEGGDRRDAQATIDADPVQGETDVNSTIYEQRTSFMINDPSAPTHITDFGKFGCFLTCHSGLRHMPQWASSHGEDTKYVDPAEMTGVGTVAADLWHWRGARSNPIALSDDQHILAKVFTDTPDTDNGGRKGDAGSGPYTSNSITDGNPAFVFDPTTTFGAYAETWDDFWYSPFGYITDPSAATMGPYAPNPMTMPWATAVAAGYTPTEGDWVPARILRAGAGSRVDITAFGSHFIPQSPDGRLGTWRVNLQRQLDTGNVDDVALVDGQSYEVGFEVHLFEYTTRDHYVSFPQSLSMNDGANLAADIVAVKIPGSGTFPIPDFDDVSLFPVKRLYLFQPGIASWEFLNNLETTSAYVNPATGAAVDPLHVGGVGMASGSACASCHTVRATEGVSTGGAMEILTKQRGGVWTGTPVLP